MLSVRVGCSHTVRNAVLPEFSQIGGVRWREGRKNKKMRVAALKHEANKMRLKDRRRHWRNDESLVMPPRTEARELFSQQHSFMTQGIKFAYDPNSPENPVQLVLPSYSLLRKHNEPSKMYIPPGLHHFKHMLPPDVLAEHYGYNQQMSDSQINRDDEDRPRRRDAEEDEENAKIGALTSDEYDPMYAAAADAVLPLSVAAKLDAERIAKAQAAATRKSTGADGQSRKVLTSDVNLAEFSEAQDADAAAKDADEDESALPEAVRRLPRALRKPAPRLPGHVFIAEKEPQFVPKPTSKEKKLRQLRDRYGDAIPERLLEQLGVDQQGNPLPDEDDGDDEIVEEDKTRAEKRVKRASATATKEEAAAAKEATA